MSICSTGLGDLSPLVVSPKKACVMLDCSMTQFYKLLNTGQIESYCDGKSRKAIVASINAHIARKLEQEAKKEPTRWTERATKVRMAKRSIKAKTP